MYVNRRRAAPRVNFGSEVASGAPMHWCRVRVVGRFLRTFIDGWVISDRAAAAAAIGFSLDAFESHGFLVSAQDHEVMVE